MSEERYYDLIDANEKGYEVGYAGRSSRGNPYTDHEDCATDGDLYDAWDRGWEAGNAQRQEEEAEGRNGE